MVETLRSWRRVGQRRRGKRSRGEAGSIGNLVIALQGIKTNLESLNKTWKEMVSIQKEEIERRKAMDKATLAFKDSMDKFSKDLK